jgi:carboxylate-amine ligase
VGVHVGLGDDELHTDLLEEMIELVRVDALALDCLPEVEHARKIVTGGTSAHRQLAVYNQAIEAGADKKEALEKVVDFLIEETVAGL